MKFTEAVEKLQKENEGTVIFVKNGIFFVAIGKDAIFLNELIGLKCTCMKEGLCKVGFLVKSSEKYIKLLQEKDVSFALFVIDKDNENLEEIFRYTGKKNEEMRTSFDCKSCMKKQDSDEEILERLRNIGK